MMTNFLFRGWMWGLNQRFQDNTFVFLNKSVDVQKRRKYFSESFGKHLKEFIYDPDVVRFRDDLQNKRDLTEFLFLVFCLFLCKNNNNDRVYATSFFSPFMNFNTFDLAIGPVKMNVAKIFGDMPICYTLRSTRVRKENLNHDEEVFVTIEFELVDEE